MNATAKVGLFAMAVLLVLAALVLKIEDLPLPGKARRATTEVVFKDVAGLDDKSAVRIAGVRVGRIDGIRLMPDGTAVARLLFDADVELRDGAYGQVKNLGLLGDKYVDLYAGDPAKPRLPDGTRIPGSVPVEFDQLTKLAQEIGRDVKAISGALSSSLGGETGEAKINRIVDNVGALTEELRLLVAANRANVDVTVANLKEFSASIRETLARLDRILDENRTSVKGSVVNIEELSEKLKTSADNLNSITGKIDKGEGTIGKLVNDETSHRNLNEAFTSIKTGVEELRTTLTRINRIDLDLGFYGEYATRTEEWRGAFRIDVTPREGKFYRIELLGLPNGRRVDETYRYETSVDGGPPSVVTTKVTRTEDKFGLSAQLGRRYKDTTLRAGLIESRGGFAIDQHLLKDRLQLSAEAWDFGRADGDAQVKLYGQWQSRGAVFLRAGVTDVINPERRSFFLGAGIRWKDEDIKTLLPSALGALR
ncbi:MAG TPA: MlaD family protein [Thermoanaerobaculia bacterium]|nr:MlaD family protein [Thermoanaerobaculia bacterium]HQP88850.1 MlaD family protein [Thermoanaerobaculia bacterium]